MSASNSTRLLFEAESVTIRGRRFVPLISSEEIDRAVEVVAGASVGVTPAVQAASFPPTGPHVCRAQKQADVCAMDQG